MNNFIEIYTTNTNRTSNTNRDVLVNLNHVISITVLYLSQREEEYWVNLVSGESYEIDREQYKEIKAKFIDNNSKE